MAIRLIDKIKQKNDADFKLLDYIDINGRITGWQNPVKKIFATVGDISGLVSGDYFIVRNASAEWPAFALQDIYGNIASKTDNAIYVLGPDDGGDAEPVYLVAAPGAHMIVYNADDGLLKKFDGIPGAWTDLITSGAATTGQVLRYEGDMVIDTTSDPGANYDPLTHRLEVGEALQAGDNINLYVNGLKYTYSGNANAFTFSAGETYLVWIPTNAGFDLQEGWEIEIEIFNQSV